MEFSELIERMRNDTYTDDDGLRQLENMYYDKSVRLDWLLSRVDTLLDAIEMRNNVIKQYMRTRDQSSPTKLDEVAQHLTQEQSVKNMPKEWLHGTF